MYTPRHFANTDKKACIALMHANSFATLVAHVDDELEATHVPMLTTTYETDSDNDIGINIAFHLARSNPICADLDAGKRTLIIFTGAHGYISPDWYAADNLVPTWNYTAVHVTGCPQQMDDTELVTLLSDLSSANEKSLNKTPWTPDSIDASLYTQMRKSIVGYNLQAQTLTGKAKLNQNRSRDDQLGAIQGLSQLTEQQDKTLVDLMRDCIADKT